MYDAGHQLGSWLSAVGISSTACGAVSVLPAVRLVNAFQKCVYTPDLHTLLHFSC